jgi:hypothetical protein
MKIETLKTLSLSLALVGLLAGCASTPPDVGTHYDQVTGLRTDLLADNELEAPGQAREVVWLNASRVFRDYRSSEYYLEVTYMALAERGYLDIPPGQSLTLILDGQPMQFDGTGSMNTRKPFKKSNHEFVQETAMYPVTKSQLQKIAGSKSIKVQIKGQNGLIEREFKEANHQRFRRFVYSYAI